MDFQEAFFKLCLKYIWMFMAIYEDLATSKIIKQNSFHSEEN